MREDPEILDRDLSLPLDIDSERWARLSTGVIRLGCLIFVCLVSIAAIAPVREIAIASGQLVTPLPPIVVEHFDGGLVEEILVREGDLVEGGAPLLRLSRGRFESELTQIQARQTFQILQRERFVAHVENRQPNFDGLLLDFPSLVAEQQALFSAESATIKAEIDATTTEIREIELEHGAAGREADSLLAQFSHAKSLVVLQRGLFERGFATRSRVLDASREMEQIRAAIAAAQRNGLAALRAISEARRDQHARSSERLLNWSEQIAELSASIAELEQSKRQQLDLLDRLVLRSPARGILHELSVGGVGEVLAPGDLVATIVPSDSELIAEVKVDPVDIGHVEVNSPAEITVTTFDREIFGALHGAVISISPTTFQIGDEDPYYVVRLSLDRLVMEGVKQTGELLPGMVVRGEIRTGEKSLLRYMLKPIARALDGAFSER